MRRYVKLLTFACCALTSCNKGQPAFLTRDALVGNYIYKSEDPEGRATDHELDHLVLQSSGRYELVQGGSKKAKSKKQGRWSFIDGDPAEVDLDHAAYPIQAKGNEIRLLIDNDVGIWYAKIQ